MSLTGLSFALDAGPGAAQQETGGYACSMGCKEQESLTDAIWHNVHDDGSYMILWE